jgi:hypothetical protein
MNAGPGPSVVAILASTVVLEFVADTDVVVDEGVAVAITAVVPDPFELVQEATRRRAMPQSPHRAIGRSRREVPISRLPNGPEGG